VHLALYLSFLATHCKTSASLLEAISAFSWVNQLAMVEDTTTHPLVVQVLAGAKRQLACLTVKKEPIIPEILTKLVDKFGQEDASLLNTSFLSIAGKSH